MGAIAECATDAKIAAVTPQRTSEIFGAGMNLVPLLERFDVGATHAKPLADEVGDQVPADEPTSARDNNQFALHSDPQ
jgi:hypothetical protein